MDKDITVRRHSAVPGLKDVHLKAQPAYTFTYRGENYSAAYDRLSEMWSVSWVSSPDGATHPMAVRSSLEQAVRDAMSDVDLIARHLPKVPQTTTREN
jgi:hypothetical protein